MATKPEYRDSKARVTQGCPGLSPHERDRKDYRGHWREYQKSLLSVSVEKKEACRRPDAGRDTTDKAQQRGIPLEGWRIASRLKRLNPSLYFELSLAMPSRMGIYYVDPLAGRRYIVGMEADSNPEFETKVLDETGECKTTLRGWRTVLAKLIRARFISEAGASRLFGPPSRDSENWANATG